MTIAYSDAFEIARHSVAKLKRLGHTYTEDVERVAALAIVDAAAYGGVAIYDAATAAIDACRRGNRYWDGSIA